MAIKREHLELTATIVGALASIGYVYTVVRTARLEGKQFVVGIQVLGKEGAPIVGALVQLGFAMEVTNVKGIASFGVPAGEYFLFVSATGYAPLEQTVKVNSNTVLPISLE